MALISFAAMAFSAVGTFNMAENNYSFGPISILVFGLYAIVIVNIALYLNRFTGKVSMFIRRVGRVSLYVLCIHSIEYMAVGSSVHYDFVNNWKGDIFTRSLIVFSVRTVVVLFATYCFVKIKYYKKSKEMRIE